MELLQKVVASGIYLFGPEKEKFERELAKFLEVESRSVVACHSGTDALVLCLLAAQVQAGHEVITAANGAIPTAAAIAQAGAQPVFCGVHPETWQMDIASCEKLINPRTRAIIPVHLYGNAFDIAELRRMLERVGRPDILIIEDTAQAFGATFQGRPLGTSGDFSAFSFYPTKNLGALGDGGAAWAKNPQHAEALRSLAFYGQPERNEALQPRGINSRLDEIQSSVLSLRLEGMSGNIARRASLMSKYREGLKGLPLRFSAVTPQARPAWHLAVVRAPSSTVREQLRAFLSESGIETLIHYPRPLHLQPAFLPLRQLENASELQRAEQLCSEILSLPFSHVHSDSEIEAVISAVQGFFKK